MLVAWMMLHSPALGGCISLRHDVVLERLQQLVATGLQRVVVDHLSHESRYEANP